MVSGSQRKYMMYSPCVVTNQPGVCSQQFNNQLWSLQHALAVADAMERTLVLPEFMVLKSSDELLLEATALASLRHGEAYDSPGATDEDINEMLSALIAGGLDQLWFPTSHFFDIQHELKQSPYHNLI